MTNPIEDAFAPLRDALRPNGSAHLTVLRIRAGTCVDADLPQRAIDEIINQATVGRALGEPETACMQLAKILLRDSAYMPNPT